MARDVENPKSRRAAGERLATSRRARNLSQSQLATAVGVESQTISKYERGLISPGPDVLFRLADKLGVDARWLAGLGPGMGAATGTEG